MFNEVALGDMHEGMITGVTAETYSLVKGVDFVDYTNLADPDTGRVVKLPVALDAAFENELEADANGNYTVPVNGADVTIYLNYYLAEDDNANGDPGVTPPGDNNPDDGWNDNEGIGTDTPNPAARLLAKVESANKNIRYWFFVPAGDNEVKVVNADETVKVTVAAHKATDDEIATASDAIKAKIDADNGEHDVWVLTFDTIGTVYETPVTKSRNTATQPPVDENELLPYRAAPTGNNGAYEFYGYKDKVVLTEDEAKTALAVALSDDDLKLKASDISIATNGLTAYYTDAKGATKTVALAPKGVDNTYGHWTATKELFAISYKGEVIYYAYDGESNVKFSGMDDGYVAWNDGTVVTTAVLEVADGTTTLSSFDLKKDSALGNVIKVSVSNGRYQYKSEGTWSSDQTDSYVVPGTEIRFWIGASNIDSPIEENGLYRAAINKNTIKTMTGAEVNEATSSGNVMVEIGALTVDMAEKGVADLSIKRVYNVNLNDQPMGAYAEDEAILAGKAGLAKDDVVFARENEKGDGTGKWAYLLSDSTKKVSVSAADNDHEEAYFTLNSDLIAKAYDKRTVDIYSGSSVKFSGDANGSLVVKYGEETSVEQTVGKDYEYYVAQGATVVLTSGENSKAYEVTVGNAEPVTKGIPSASAPTTVEIEVGEEDIIIKEVTAYETLVVSFSANINGDAVGSSTPWSSLFVSVWNGNVSAIENKTADSVVDATAGDPRPTGNFTAGHDYIITISDLKAADGYTLSTLTNESVTLNTALTGWSLLNTVVNYDSGSGSLELVLTVHINSL